MPFLRRHMLPETINSISATFCYRFALPENFHWELVILFLSSFDFCVVPWGSRAVLVDSYSQKLTCKDISRCCMMGGGDLCCAACFGADRRHHWMRAKSKQSGHAPLLGRQPVQPSALCFSSCSGSFFCQMILLNPFNHY